MVTLICISVNVNDVVYNNNNNNNNNNSAAQRHVCQSLVHVKFNKLISIDYYNPQGSNDPWYCLSCCSKILLLGQQEIKTSSLL